MRYVGLFALVITQSVGAQDNRSALLARIDSVVSAEMRRGQVPGVSVAVERRGELILAKGYGFADVESSVPASAETIYRIGSITKQFTAVGIMQLVEQGKLALTDEITKYLPDYPTQGHRVTIEHLLTHTSGIKSYTSLGAKAWNETFRLDLSNDQMLDLFKNQPFDFNPGEKYQYNNSAFFLLGVLIERITGLPYPQYLGQKILAPLGLQSTAFCDDQAIVAHRAHGYAVDNGVVVNANPISMRVPGAAGSICSDVLDLLAWQRAFDAAKLISPASRDRMRTSAKLNNGTATNYGYGLGVSSFEGHRSVAHSGGVNGFVSWLGRFPDDDVTVAILTNSGSGPAPRIGELIARLALGLELPKVADLPVPADLRARLVGAYDIGGTQLTVRDQDGALWVEYGATPKDRLMYQGDNEFRPHQNPEFAVRFDPESGAVTLITPGGNTRGKKK